MRNWGLILLTTLSLCVACTEGKVYHHYNHTPVAGWEKVDTLAFDVPPLNDSGLYSTDLGLRITNDFPFMGLTLIVEQTVYPSHVRKTDTLNCKLIDKDGTVKGQGISYYQYRFQVSQMQLHLHDSLHITVRHNMKREILPGISDIGIAVNKLR
ncbi:MAG: gliding motility lipoprotein GldH [Prevotella sp.]|nr:gliding motility lipoprotein GldH [Prevotella sp.]